MVGRSHIGGSKSSFRQPHGVSISFPQKVLLGLNRPQLYLVGPSWLESPLVLNDDKPTFTRLEDPWLENWVDLRRMRGLPQYPGTWCQPRRSPSPPPLALEKKKSREPGVSFNRKILIAVRSKHHAASRLHFAPPVPSLVIIFFSYSWTHFSQQRSDLPPPHRNPPSPIPGQPPGSNVIYLLWPMIAALSYIIAPVLYNPKPTYRSLLVAATDLEARARPLGWRAPARRIRSRPDHWSRSPSEGKIGCALTSVSARPPPSEGDYSDSFGVRRPDSFI